MNRLVKIPLYVCCVLGLFCMNVYAASGYVCLHLWDSGEYQKAVSTCENACSKNDSCGCLGLGNLYLMGDGVKQDYIKAKTYFEKACNLSDYGCSGLGDLYSRDDETIMPDYSKAKNYYERACKHKNGAGCYGLGALYYQGHGVKQNYIKVKTYFEKACDLGYNSACLEDYSEIATPETERQKRDYEKACNDNDGRGCSNLGKLYAAGDGVERDESKAKIYYEKACNKLNNGDGCFRLGMLYNYGDTVEHDNKKALTYYEKACSLNNGGGCRGAGDLYHKGDDVKKDYKKALTYFEKACNLNDGDGCYRIGSLYNDGEGVKQDYRKALTYYEKACNLNEGTGCFNLGNLYYNGQSVKQDYSKAFTYYEKACNLKYYDGCNILGDLYVKGLGVGRDYNKAKIYYEKGCALECRDIEDEIKNANATDVKSPEQSNTFFSKIGKQHNDKIKSLEQACNRNIARRCFDLGDSYYNGEGVKQDYSKALTYYEKSCHLDYGDACKKVGEIYELGKYGVEENERKSEIYYEKACSLEERYCSTKNGGIEEKYSDGFFNSMMGLIALLLILGIVVNFLGCIIRIIKGILTEPWGDHGEDDFD